MGLSVRVLGPVRAFRGVEECDIGSPQQRAVLAALAINAGRHLSARDLVDVVWGRQPPRSAAQIIRTYIHRLRAVLGDAEGGGSSVIASASRGYTLLTGAERLDVTVFRERLIRAREAYATRDLHTAMAYLREALALWRGEPLAGITGEFCEKQRRTMENLRLSALELRIEIDFVLGRHSEALLELEALVAEFNFNEGLWGMLMLGYAESGNRHRALAAFRELRALLSNELGIEPGRNLQRLHARILGAQVEGPDEWRHLAAAPGRFRHLPGDGGTVAGAAPGPRICPHGPPVRPASSPDGRITPHVTAAACDRGGHIGCRAESSAGTVRNQ